MPADKRVLAKAVCALCVVVVGSLLIYVASPERRKNTVSMETQNDATVLMKAKQRKEQALQTVQNLLFPADVCVDGTPPFGQMSGVAGICEYVNGQNGCCNANLSPADIPQVEPSKSCSSACLSMLYSLWCFVGCTDGVQSDVALANRQPLCTETATALFDSCNNCPTFGSFLDFNTYQIRLANTIPLGAPPGCIDFYATNTRLPVEDSAPIVITQQENPNAFVLTAASVPPSVQIPREANINNPAATGAAASLPPAFGTIAFKTPDGDEGLVIPLTSTSFVQVAPNRWRATVTNTLGRKAPSGTWTVVAKEISNTNGTVRDQDISMFSFTSDFTEVRPLPGGDWGNVQLCSGASGDHTGTTTLNLQGAETVDELVCCDSSTCNVRCGSTTSTNNIDQISGSTANPPLVISGCKVTSATPAVPAATNPVWDLPAQTTLASTIINFSGAGKIVDIGRVANQESSVSSSDGSTITFASGAQLRQVVDGSTVSMGITTEFDAASTLTLSQPNQIFQVTDNGSVTLTGSTATFNAANQRFIISPAPNERRATVLVKGAIMDGGNANTIGISSGRLEVQPSAADPAVPGRINANVHIGSASALNKQKSRSKKFRAQQTSDPSDFVAEICCGSFCGNNIAIEESAALFIVPETGSAQSVCQIGATTSAAEIGGTLAMAANSRIVFTGARAGGPRLIIRNGGGAAVAFSVATNVVMEVELSTVNAENQQFEITLLEWQVATTNCDAAGIQVVVVNEDPARPITQRCDTDNGFHRLIITIPAANAQNPIGTNVPTFRSSHSFVITFNQIIQDFPKASFLQAIREVTGVETANIEVLSYLEETNNNIKATFDCLSTQSVQHADATCNSIVADANTNSNALNNRLRVIASVAVDNDDEDDDGGSNTALYGLFAFALLVPLCVFGICLALKHKRRKADNQYVQDTATFSNVAASAQAINYPYPHHEASQAVLDSTQPVAIAEPMVVVESPVKPDIPPAYLP